jgi:hypothetical protein
MPCGSFQAKAVFVANGAVIYNLYLGFRFHALGSGWKSSQGQTVRWRLFQTVGKIVRYGRLMILEISAAILSAFPRSTSVARASCGKEAPFRRRRDPESGIFRS